MTVLPSDALPVRSCTGSGGTIMIAPGVQDAAMRCDAWHGPDADVCTYCDDCSGRVEGGSCDGQQMGRNLFADYAPLVTRWCCAKFHQFPRSGTAGACRAVRPSGFLGGSMRSGVTLAIRFLFPTADREGCLRRIASSALSAGPWIGWRWLPRGRVERTAAQKGSCGDATPLVNGAAAS